MTRADQITKVCKLRVLSLRAGTAEEAATAARLAHGLRLKYKLTEDELWEAPPVDKQLSGSNGKLSKQVIARHEKVLKASRRLMRGIEKQTGLPGLADLAEPFLKQWMAGL